MNKDTFFTQPEGAGSSIETTCCALFSTELAIFHLPKINFKPRIIAKGDQLTLSVCVYVWVYISFSLMKRGATAVFV